MALDVKSKVEPMVLWNLKAYPLTYIPLIVQVKKNLDSFVEKKLQELGCKDLIYFSIIDGFYSLVPVHSIKSLMNFPEVLYLSFDHSVYALGGQTLDASYDYKINTYGLSGRNIVLANLDTGIPSNRELNASKLRIIHFKDFVNGKSSSYDDHGHGSKCVEIIKSHAPDTLLIGLKCLNEAGSGNIKNVLKALQWIMDYGEKHKIRIVHIPLGYHCSYPLGKDPLEKAVENLISLGMVVVCAAGNSGPRKVSVFSPGTSKEAITVGSLEGLKSFSSKGPTLAGLSKPDIIAPGKSGTSLSSSYVASTIALLLEKYPSLHPDEVKLALESSCDSLHLDKYSQGKGLVNIGKLLSNNYL